MLSGELSRAIDATDKTTWAVLGTKVIDFRRSTVWADGKMCGGSEGLHGKVGMTDRPVSPYR